MNEEMLKQNPLLILIAICSYAINDLEVEKEVEKMILDNKELIKKANPILLYQEFKKLMGTNNPAKYIRKFKEVFFLIIPGLEKTYNFKQNNPWHIYDVFEHTMHVIENTSFNESLRMAALFHDLGKPLVYQEETKTNEDGTTYQVGHFYNHHLRSKIIFSEFAEKFSIPEEEKELISKLIIYHDYKLGVKPKKIQEYINDLGIENIPLLFELKRADNLAQNPQMTQKVLKELEQTQKIFMEYINNLSTEKEESKIWKK